MSGTGEGRLQPLELAAGARPYSTARARTCPRDVAAAIRTWMVETGRLDDGARITNLEVRGWLP